MTDSATGERQLPYWKAMTLACLSRKSYMRYEYNKNRYLLAILAFLYRISKRSVFDLPIPRFVRSDSFDAAIILEVPDVLFDGSRANA